jgi:sortase A
MSVPSRKLLALIGILALLFVVLPVLWFTLVSPAMDSGALRVYATDGDPSADTQVPIYEGQEQEPGWPVRLTIPRIGVDAQVQPVGVTPSGQMAAPQGRLAVGWYGFGTRPGEVGSAVIDGHRGYAIGHAVFDDLPKLSPGDKIFVYDPQGGAVGFVVRDSKTYLPDAKVPEVFHSSKGRHLNLITCAGSWNPLTGSHSERLVVFADAIEGHSK